MNAKHGEAHDKAHGSVRASGAGDSGIAGHHGGLTAPATSPTTLGG
jgi:hypothetical protein